MSTIRRIVRSESLDALRAKDRDARRRLANHLVAFVRAPKRKGMPRGWVFYATDSHLATHTHMEDDQKPDSTMFIAFMVGNPVAQVHESRDLVQELCDVNSDRMDEKDSYANLVMAEVKGYQTLYLEDKDEPRANAVEFLFIDDEEDVYFCAFDGSYGGQAIRGKDQAILIRGCYDDEVRREVKRALQRHCRVSRPSKASLLAAVRKIRRATGLKSVGYVPVP